jgi:hypothetical protein
MIHDTIIRKNSDRLSVICTLHNNINPEIKVISEETSTLGVGSHKVEKDGMTGKLITLQPGRSREVKSAISWVSF